ncbi:hypothetical protein [Thermogemmatispora carboxidivorans]|uniref:hypothetical protein n=1 Tax=Thermogemmatispora carboxidivorans TaxID=1382306 RepID=UPI0006999812|nr:hypothetical protein [Thermogemmatispora carboxidivorans]
MIYQWLVFAHILGIFGFLIAHGAVAAVTFALPRQREVERVRVLLDLSRSVSVVANVSLLVLLAAGVAAGFMGKWWGQGWIWTSLALFVLMSVSMSFLGSRPLDPVRQLVYGGKPSRSGASGQISPDPSAEKQLAALLAATHPWLLTVIGGGGMVLILWLMMFKPF